MKYLEGKFDEVVKTAKEAGEIVTVVVDQTNERETNSIRTMKYGIAKKCKLNYTGYNINQENKEYRNKVTDAFDIDPEKVFKLDEGIIVFPSGRVANKLDYTMVEASLKQLHSIMEKDKSDTQYYIKAPFHYMDKENMALIKDMLENNFDSLNLNVVEYKGEPMVLVPGQIYIGYAVSGLRASAGEVDVIGPWFSDDMLEGKPNIQIVKWLSDNMEVSEAEGNLDNYILTEVFTKKRMDQLMNLINTAKNNNRAFVITDWNKLEDGDPTGCIRKLIKKKLESEFNMSVTELK